MEIEIRPHNKVKEFLHKTADKLEDFLFSVILAVPEKFIPSFLMDWFKRYATKRLIQLQQQTVKQAWRNMYLEDAVNELSTKQAQK
jgi:hypothetical protein